ncbi:MAG: hypothetical protein IJX93_02955 [Clostridia bacterium]|nr:hypothetical protein [Clostridia bacterium]MBQ8511730.1 hypothetical protein [Clostridia bacterium]
MQYYIMILIAVVLLAVQFASNKAYSIRQGSHAKASLTFTTLVGVTCAVVMFLIAVVSGEGFVITPYSLGMGAIVAALCCTYTFIGFKIMALGSLSVYTMFLMLGGMMLPYLYGVFLLDEAVSVWRIIGFVLLAASLVFPVVAREKSGKSSVIFIVLCLAVFCLNGCVSITSKVHQINEIYAKSGSASFSFITNSINAVMSAIGLGIITLREKKQRNAKAEDGPTAVYEKPKTPARVIAVIVLINAVAGGVSYVLQLVSAAHVAASALYPMITGGSMVLSALAGLICFGEKPDKISLIGLILSFAATFLFLF